jgi:hypothetical protein
MKVNVASLTCRRGRNTYVEYHTSRFELPETVLFLCILVSSNSPTAATDRDTKRGEGEKQHKQRKAVLLLCIAEKRRDGSLIVHCFVLKGDGSRVTESPGPR